MQQTPILGRLISVRTNKGTSTGLRNLNKEQQSTLTITREYVKGAGSSATQNKNHAMKKSWRISATMLFTLSDFINFLDQIRQSADFAIDFDHSGGLVYSGRAFPTNITLQGTKRSLVKMQVQWQGTGPLYVN